jgi:hypothetical protein
LKLCNRFMSRRGAKSLEKSFRRSAGEIVDERLALIRLKTQSSTRNR